MDSKTNPLMISETPEQRTKRILDRVRREGLLPGIELQVAQHKRMEQARNACLEAMRSFAANPIGRDINEVLVTFQGLLEKEQAEREKFVELAARG